MVIAWEISDVSGYMQIGQALVGGGCGIVRRTECAARVVVGGGSRIVQGC